jgi:hypothetical protein
MSNTEKKYGSFHDALTGETITRELTPDEIALSTEPTHEIAPTGV